MAHGDPDGGRRPESAPRRGGALSACHRGQQKHSLPAPKAGGRGAPAAARESAPGTGRSGSGPRRRGARARGGFAPRTASRPAAIPPPPLPARASRAPRSPRSGPRRRHGEAPPPPGGPLLAAASARWGWPGAFHAFHVFQVFGTSEAPGQSDGVARAALRRRGGPRPQPPVAARGPAGARRSCRRKAKARRGRGDERARQALEALTGAGEANGPRRRTTAALQRPCGAAA